MTAQSVLDLTPVSMEEAVGYPAISCAHGERVEGTLVLKNDHIFCLLDSHGDVTPPGNCALGLFYDDTRMLSSYELTVAGGTPVLLSSQSSRMYSGQIDLAISDLAFGGDTWNVSNVIHIRRELLVDDRMTERLTLTSFLQKPVDYWVQLAFGCDFADIFEVRGWTRAKRGQFYAPHLTDESVRFLYRGVDGELIRSEIRFHVAPGELSPDGATWRMRLEPQQPVVLSWQILPDALLRTAEMTRTPVPTASLDAQRRPMRAAYERWRAECTRFDTDVEEFNDALGRSTVDLRALQENTTQGPVVTAGIPWYSTPFGRDSIITAIQTLCLDPRIAIETLRFLARYQGTHEDAFTEEQPGKIMHELRRGELARAREVPHVPYYGSIDATPLWLVLLHETWRWTGDLGLVRELLPAAEGCLAWIDRYGDLDGDGFVEYASQSKKGLANQGWKDSWDGVPFPDGSLPEPPIALVEVQGYVYDAKRRAAALFEALDQLDRAKKLRDEAETLREKILDHFWLDDIGFFALALDGHKRPLPTVTTNAGHLLWSRVPTDRQAASLAHRFLAPDMFSGWGVRTLSATHGAYNPMSYHNGSVWPHDNAIVALGLSLYERTHAALTIFAAMHDAASAMAYHRLPELWCGMQREHATRPVLYPVSCSPQAWAAGAFFMLLQAATGILPDAPARTLHIREPLLPPFLGHLIVRGLRVGTSTVALQFTRRRERTLANVLDVEGDALHVRIELH